jgi:hypothetical protein
MPEPTTALRVSVPGWIEMSTVSGRPRTRESTALSTSSRRASVALR